MISIKTTNTIAPRPNRTAYAPKEWEKLASLSHAKVCELIRDRDIETVKVGRARRILTSPEEYFARLAAEQALDIAI